jgi:hypothetical protein
MKLLFDQLGLLAELALRRRARRDKGQCRLRGQERRFRYDGAASRDEDDAEDQNDGRKARGVVIPGISCKTACDRGDEDDEANQQGDLALCEGC